MSLCLGLIKIGKCEKSTPTVQNHFSQNVENVNKLLNEVNQQINTEIENKSKASNDLSLTNLNVSGSKFKLTLEQKAKAESLQMLNQALKMIMDSDFSADVKLDALMNLTNDVKNNGSIFNKGSSEDLNDINIKNDNNIQLINNLNNNLRIIAEVIAENKMLLDGINITEGADVDISIKQSADGISNQIQDLVNNVESGITAEEKEVIKDDITKSISEESTGIVKGISDNITDTVKSTNKTIIIIIAIIILILGCGLIYFLYSLGKIGMKGGNDRFIEDTYYYDEL